jgi:hypothetical protein
MMIEKQATEIKANKEAVDKIGLEKSASEAKVAILEDQKSKLSE